MKKGIFPIMLAVLLAVGFYACNENDDLVEKTGMQEQIKSKAIVLKERDPNSPLILSKKVIDEPERKLKSGNEPFKKYLGRSFKMNTLPLTDYRNFGPRVIEVETYLKDNPNGSDTDRIGYTDNYSFAYTNFSKYVEKSEVQKKVKGGFKLNLGLFSIGAKRSMERTFSKTKVEERNRVFGELHYLYQDSRYWLTTNSYDVKEMQNYLSKSFLNHLYNNTPTELYEYYGRFIMCDFIVGGKAIALYSGVYQGNESSETRGKKMQTDIDASYGKTVSGDFGFGRGYTNGKEFSNKFTDLRASVKTLGGIGAVVNFSNPEKVSSVNVNLTSWLSSLNNKNNHSIIEFSDDGLLPITEFVEEDNLKYQLETYRPIERFYEPVLVYGYLEVLNRDLLCIQTRFGDIIRLYNEKHTSKTNIQNLIAKYSSAYKLKTVDVSWYLNGPLMDLMPIYVESEDELDDNSYEVYMSYVFNFNVLDTSFSPMSNDGMYCNKTIGDTMKKYVCNNKTYLISQKQGVKFAYSIYDDYILDTYGIREWVKNMPTTQLTDRELDEYTIVAL
jgi:hypothetical protein